MVGLARQASWWVASAREASPGYAITSLALLNGLWRERNVGGSHIVSEEAVRAKPEVGLLPTGEL